MNNREFRKLLKNNKSNTGFTLTELLVGLVMSIFVIGALGFGLMQVLRSSQTESSKIAARNETSRALEFISDELRRAQSIEVDMTSGNISSVAPNYTVPTGGTVRLALQIPEASERVIYSVAPPQSGSPWKGPLVIYRWGPELTADGSYSTTGSGRVDNPAGWTNEALVDKVDDTNQTQSCGGSNTTYQGFFACVVDDDGDGVTENEVTDTNGNGVIENDDVDGSTITAQLYFAGEVLDSSYSADTQAVARARTAPDSNSEDLDSYTMSFRTLDPSFGCNGNDTWKMRTDVGESLSTPSNLTQWNHDPLKPRQPQPIKITGDTLVISSIPRDPSGTGNCLNARVGNGREGNTDSQDFTGNKTLGEKDAWKDTADVVAISHVIDFTDPTTFNGDKKNTCNGNNICGGSNGGKVNTKKSDNTKVLNTAVKMLKRGSTVPDYGGYDVNDDGIFDSANGDQPSLGEFLHSKGLADKSGPDDNPVYTINNDLKPDERIIGFEVGHNSDSNTNPGVDYQDNIFIVTSEAFKKEYDYTPLP